MIYFNDYIDVMLYEMCVIYFSVEFQVGMWVSCVEYECCYCQSFDQFDDFWLEVVYDFYWMKDWDWVFDWQELYVQWFVGGQMNIVYNVFDCNVQCGFGDKWVIIWEGEDGEVWIYIYVELLCEVCKVVNVLEEFGVVVGD